MDKDLSVIRRFNHCSLWYFEKKDTSCQRRTLMNPCPDPTHPNFSHSTASLLEGDETGRVGGTNTGTTVLDGLAVAGVRDVADKACACRG